MYILVCFVILHFLPLNARAPGIDPLRPIIAVFAADTIPLSLFFHQTFSHTAIENFSNVVCRSCHAIRCVAFEWVSVVEMRYVKAQERSGRGEMDLITRDNGLF